MNILHVADMHFGAIPMRNGLRGNDILDSGKAILDIVEEVQEENPISMVILAGDILDTDFPRPYAIMAYKNLVWNLAEREIYTAVIAGNHDSNRKDLRFQDNSWPNFIRSCIQSRYRKFVLTENMDRETGLPVERNINGVSVCLIDYRPQIEIKEILAKMPSWYCDILVMHQSFEGAVPNIANPDLCPNDVMGKAFYVALGDIHVRFKKSFNTGSGITTVAYPGPSEWKKTDEIPHTGFAFLRFKNCHVNDFTWLDNPNSRERISIEVIPGGLVDFTDHLSGILQDTGEDNFTVHDVPTVQGSSYTFPNTPRAIDEDKRVLIELKYPHRVDDLGKELARFLGEFLYSKLTPLFKNTPITMISKLPRVDVSFDFEGGLSGEMGQETDDMRNAITEYCKDDEVKSLALDIWQSPDDTEIFIEDYAKEA